MAANPDFLALYSGKVAISKVAATATYLAVLLEIAQNFTKIGRFWVFTATFLAATATFETGSGRENRPKTTTFDRVLPLKNPRKRTH